MSTQISPEFIKFFGTHRNVSTAKGAQMLVDEMSMKLAQAKTERSKNLYTAALVVARTHRAQFVGR